LKGEILRGAEHSQKITYPLRSSELSLVLLVDEAFIQKRHQRIRVDMGREVKLPVRLVDPPLLLQLGGSLSIICGELVSPGLTSTSQPSTRGAQDRQLDTKMNPARQCTYLTQANTWIFKKIRAESATRPPRYRRPGPRRNGWVKTTNLQTRKLTRSVSSSSFMVGAPTPAMRGDSRVRRVYE
jgi:hypothetical protein